MKCPNCGSNLSIDDERCSFCGADNSFAKKHRSQMRHFTREFNKTKADVLKKSNHLNKWAVKITLIAVLVALNCLILFMAANSYEIEHFFVNRSIDANYHKHKAVLDEYEADRNFFAFDAYYNKHQLYYNDRMNEYRAVENVCSNYIMVYEYVMAVVTEEEDEYNSHANKMEYLSDQLDYIYKYSKPQEYSDEEQYQPVHQECMDDMVAQLEDLLQTYFHVSDEDIEAFPEMSKARRQIVMEEGLGLYE